MFDLYQIPEYPFLGKATVVTQIDRITKWKTVKQTRNGMPYIIKFFWIFETPIGPISDKRSWPYMWGNTVLISAYVLVSNKIINLN